MRRLVQWLKRKREEETPTTIGVLIVLVLVADLALVLAFGKKHLFPFSKTIGDYLLWVGTIISFVTGYIFWPLSIAAVVLRAFLTRKKLGSLEVTPIVERVFNRIAVALAKLSLSVPTLTMESVCLVALVWGVVWASYPPAPPRPGQLVISAHPGVNAYFLARSSGVGLYPSGLPGNGPNSPVENLSFPSVTPPAEICGSSVATGNIQHSDDLDIQKRKDDCANWRGLQNIAVSFDGTQVYATDAENGLVHFISTQPWLHQVGVAYIGKTVKSLALSADGRKLYVADIGGPTPNGKIHVFEAGNSKEASTIGNVGCPEDLFVASTKPLLFVASQCGLNNDPLYVIDTREDRVIKTVPGFAVSSQVIATHDGSTVYVPTDDGLKIVRDYLSNKPYIHAIPQTGVAAMALTVDETTLIVGLSVESAGHTFGELVSFNAQTGVRCKNKPFSLIAPPGTIVIAPDGALMIPTPQVTLEAPDGRLITYGSGIKVGDSRALECGGSG